MGVYVDDLAIDLGKPPVVYDLADSSTMVVCRIFFRGGSKFSRGWEREGGSKDIQFAQETSKKSKNTNFAPFASPPDACEQLHLHLCKNR